MLNVDLLALDHQGYKEVELIVKIYDLFFDYFNLVSVNILRNQVFIVESLSFHDFSSFVHSCL
jgi:hypothetical protein